MLKTFKQLIIMLILSGFVFPAIAWEHEDSLVDFQVYSEQVIGQNRGEKKPYFLLFAAEWCYWCHQFAQKTLVRQDVADYLNQNFVNVFIDADINNAAYVKYRATGLPYTVFLNPDGSLYYQYAGTLYGDNFLAVIKEVSAKAGAGKYALGMEANRVSYTPPTKLSLSDLKDLPNAFKQGLLENFDTSEYGLGRGQKSILPESFLYLLENANSTERKQVIDWITKTLERAIDSIYDPVEGGFFRYAETRNWQVPHFEKLADLNAGTILLLYRLNQLSPSPKLKKAADKTLSYLSSKLFHPLTGSFLSFQVADYYYYDLNSEQRKSTTKPKVMDKIFTDRLATTLGYLMPVIEYSGDRTLEIQVKQSLDFLAKMVAQSEGISRYYLIPDQRWREKGGLYIYARVAHVFSKAATHFQSNYYASVATKVVQMALRDYFDDKKGIFIDPYIDDSTNAEHLMEINGLLAQSIVGLGDRLKPRERNITATIITYFSQMGDVLDERLWNAIEWEFVESYVPYLKSIDNYLPVSDEG